MSLPPRKTRSITLNIGEHEFDAFMRHVGAFRDTDAAGRPNWERAAEARADAHDASLDALAQLLELAEAGEGTSGEVAARVLAALYNGYDFPLNLGELRAAEETTLNACLAVMRLAAIGGHEVHTYNPDGEKRWHAFMRRWGLLPEATRTPFVSDAPRYQVTFDGVQAAPGYRDATVVAKVLRSNVADEAATAVELVFRAADTEQLARELVNIHQRAWSGKRSLDVKPEEMRPLWL